MSCCVIFCMVGGVIFILFRKRMFVFVCGKNLGGY